MCGNIALQSLQIFSLNIVLRAEIATIFKAESGNNFRT